MLKYFIPNTRNQYKPYLLRTPALAVYTLILLFSNIFLSGFSGVYASTITSNNLINLTNLERERYGLNNLKSSPELTSAAVAKAHNMFSEQYWDHFGPNNETPWQFIKESGYAYVYAGENLAKGFKTAEGVVEGWLASPTHRENMLSGNYTEVGFAVVNGELLGEETTLVVQMLGNTTDNIMKTPDVYENTSQNEAGSTSSIRIEKPSDEVIINDRTVDIEGEVLNVDNEYTVKLYDNEGYVIEDDFNEKEWELSKNSDWSEGEHNVSVELYTDEVIDTDTVSFVVDSTPPKVDERSLLITDTEGSLGLSVFINDPHAESYVVVGNDQYPMQLEEDGYMSASIKGKVLGEEVKIVSSDEVGNVTVVDISDSFDDDDATKKVGSIDWGRGVTVSVAGFVFVLMLIEIYTYVDKKLIHKHGGNLLTVGVWWIILVLSILTGFSGTIV
jgi:hypothetical protein